MLHYAYPIHALASLCLAESRPAELFFQMHLLARRLTKGFGATSNLEPSTSPLRWILEAIHMNPSCLRYWRALLKFME